MNKKAAELGMADTVFKNCNGLDEEGHVTSAYDVALMSRALMKHEAIFRYTSIWIDYLRDGKTQLVNTNKLLKLQRHHRPQNRHHGAGEGAVCRPRRTRQAQPDRRRARQHLGDRPLQRSGHPCSITALQTMP